VTKELDLVNGNGEENGLENAPQSLSVEGGLAAVPALVLSGGERSAYRFLEFFAANIRNRNTRLAYYHAVCEFFAWCEARRVRELTDIRSHHVAGYIEQITQTYAAPSVKQHLAAIRMLFDWLVVGQIVSANPAHAVRGPKYSATKGKTPVLLGEEARLLLDSITTDTVVGLRDRVFIALLVYSFARVSAAIGMNVEDIYVQGKRTWLRLHEKGGKRHEMPAHHELEALLDEYLATVHPDREKNAPLFYSALGKTGLLTKNRLHRIDAYRLVKRRARAAGILSPIGCHTFRATGITQYLLNGGSLEKAQLMAAHASPRTTKLYDRTQDEVTLDEVERIMLR
jgi:site-specific recombinase XerD